MRSFAYASPKSLREALALLERDGARVLAGGTDLLSLMKDGVESPELLVNVKEIEELQNIEEGEEGEEGEERGRELRVGAAVTLAELAAHPAVRERLPALHQAIDGILSPQIREMGTVAGDLCQRPRCWYYRSGFGLLAQQDKRSMVEAGDNRYHAIFGDGPARFCCPSSLAPGLIALDARVQIEGPGGSREVATADFFREPRREGEREHDLDEREMIVAITLPDPGGRANATYEVRSRRALDWPLIAAAVSFRLDGGRASDARVVLGHAAPIPWSAPAAARALEAGGVDEDRAEAAGRAAVAEARPLGGNAYKVQLGRVAVKRAALRAAGREV